MTGIIKPHVQNHLEFVNGVMAATDHDSNDPYLDELVQRFANNELTLEEASDLAKKYILSLRD